MPEFISVRELAKDPRIAINGKPRNHRALITLLRRRFKLVPVMVRFPAQHHGMPVAALSKEEAEAVIKSLTSVEVVGEKETTTKQDD